MTTAARTLASSASQFSDLKVVFNGKTFTGKAVLGKSWLKGQNPIVLCFPDVMGCRSLDMFRCLHISQTLGCAAVAVDLYGDAFPPHERELRAMNIGKAFTMMNELLANPVYLRQLMRAYINEAVAQLNGDPERVAAVGFCFGGACVLEMIRDGAPVKAVVSMHGTLDAKPLMTLDGKPPPPMKMAPPAPKHTPGSHVLVCHGAVDPLVPAKVVSDFMAEMEKAPLGSFTFSSYGKTRHAFTTPNMEEGPNDVIAFNGHAARRAWISAFDLFAQALGIRPEREVSPELWTNVIVFPRL